MRYEVDADLYEGPLPLLVELSRLRLIDVFLIQLVDLTQAYLGQLKAIGRELRSIGLNEMAEPLPLLGHLVALKARRMLPESPRVDGDDEEVPISLEELERRLKEYAQFKTVAQLLAELHALQHEHFTRQADPALSEVGAESRDTPFEVSLQDLMGAFSKVLTRASAPVYEVLAEPWTVEMKVQELRMLLTVKRQVRFLDLFATGQHKLELVVTFLALLELMRQRVVRAIQERPFTDILIQLRAGE